MIQKSSPQRPYFCSNDLANVRQASKPKNGSYIDALTFCDSQNTKIASVSEMKTYWKNVDYFDSQACRNSFWTSNKQFNSTHFKIGNDIEAINFNEFHQSENGASIKRIPVASFDTLKFEASKTDFHLCICILYQIRKVGFHQAHNGFPPSLPSPIWVSYYQRKYRNHLRWQFAAISVLLSIVFLIAFVYTYRKLFPNSDQSVTHDTSVRQSFAETYTS